MKRGFKCKEEILDLLKREYDLIVLKEYNGEYLRFIEDIKGFLNELNFLN